MKTYIKILKDIILTVSVNNIEIKVKVGDMLVINDNKDQLYYNGKRTDDSEYNISGFLYYIKHRESTAYKIYTEQEYRDIRLNKLLDESN